MNIVFWSEIGGELDNTANLLAISSMLAIKCENKVILMQARYATNRFSTIFESTVSDNVFKEDFSYYHQKGVDAILDSIRLNNLDEDMLFSNIVNIYKDNYFVIPTSERKNEAVYNSTFLEECCGIMRKFNQSDNFLCIDAMGCGDAESLLLEEADIIVVTISQHDIKADIQVLDMKKYGNKVIYIVGRYDYDSSNGIVSLRKNSKIKKDDIGIIPYDTELIDSIRTGCMISYIERCNEGKKNVDKQEMLDCISRISKIILKRGGYEQRKGYKGTNSAS